MTFYPGCEYLGDREFVSRVSGKRYAVRPTARVVDAHYLAPQIPSRTPAPFGASDDVRVVTVNDLVQLDEAPSQYVIVGSGKTATDACIWLLERGVDPDAICWVRPRDPWMLNRAVVQPNPAIFIGMAADVLEIAAGAASADEMFLGMEEAGVMLRIDRSVTPTMAKTPTLATWELDQLRTIEHVVRLGYIQHAEPGRLVLDDGEVGVAKDAVVVHCAAPGLVYPPLVPIWREEAITLQPVRTGFPCFGAAIAGHVEATRDADEEKNRLCPPSPLPNTTPDWARMQVLGSRASMAFASDPELKAWADQTAAQPGAGPAGPGRLGRGGCRRRTVPRARRAGPGPHGRARGHGVASTVRWRRKAPMSPDEPLLWVLATSTGGAAFLLHAMLSPVRVRAVRGRGTGTSSPRSSEPSRYPHSRRRLPSWPRRSATTRWVTLSSPAPSCWCGSSTAGCACATTMTTGSRTPASGYDAVSRNGPCVQLGSLQAVDARCSAG